MDGQILLAVSGKGGTGKTTLGAGVCACLGVLGHPALLVDCDVGMRNADITLGLSDRAVMDFRDVLMRRAEPDDAIIDHPDIPGLSLLPAPSDWDGIDFELFAALLRALKRAYSFVWLDGPAGRSDWVKALAKSADLIIMVATPDVSSVKDAARLTAALEENAPGKLVVNRVRRKLITGGGAMSMDDIMDETGLPLLGLVPEDERVITSGNKGVPIVLEAEDGAAAAYRDIAMRLLGKRVALGID